MKKSEVKEKLKELQKSANYMSIYNATSWYREVVKVQIEIYERLLKEGYQKNE